MSCTPSMCAGRMESRQAASLPVVPSKPAIQNGIFLPSAAPDQDLIRQLKKDLSEQLDEQYGKLVKEVKILHQDLVSRVTQEVKTMQHVDIDRNNHSPDKKTPATGVNAMGERSQEEGPKQSNDFPCSALAGNFEHPQGQFQAAAAKIITSQSLQVKAKKSPDWMPSNLLKKAGTMEQMSEFNSRPDLRAYMQARNWESPAFSKKVGSPSHEDLSKPAKKNCLRARLQLLVEASWFDLVVGVAILLNAFIMSLSLEFDGLTTADSIGLKRDEGDWPRAKEAFMGFQHIFTIFFTIELLLKLIVYGCHFFKQLWNWLDFIIVASAVLETYIFHLLDFAGPNMSFMRLLRIGKIVKVLRIVRVLRVFSQLRVLLVAIVSSFPALAWSMALLAIVQLIGSIFMTQSLQGFLQDDSNELELREFVYEYFGSFSRSWMTMFEMTLAPGTWSRFGRRIIYDVHRGYMVFFFGYAACVSFAMIRVIAAIFLKETLNAAAKDNETVMAEVNRNPEFIRGIRKVFDESDVDKSGHISLAELDEMLEDKRSRAFLDVMGIKVHEVSGLFTLMDDGDEQITFAEFLAGVMRLKARGGIDLVTLLYENKRILMKVLNLERIMEGMSAAQQKK